jgi:hypothetical protein
MLCAVDHKLVVYVPLELINIVFIRQSINADRDRNTLTRI